MIRSLTSRQQPPTLDKSADFSFGDTISTARVTAGAGGVTGTLPSAVGRQGLRYTMIKIDSAAGAAIWGTVLSQTINGVVPPRNVVGQWSEETVESNGANWLVVDNDRRLISTMESAGCQRVYRSPLSPVGTSFLTLTGVAYFVYLGRTAIPLTPKYVEAYLNVVGATLTLAEAGFFSTPLPPNKAGQSLSKIAAVATWDSLTAGLGLKRSGSMSTLVPSGTHLWAGFRGAYTTMPTFAGLLYDLQQGMLLVTAGAAAFSTAGPWTGALVAAQTAAAMVTCCPDLCATLD